MNHGNPLSLRRCGHASNSISSPSFPCEFLEEANLLLKYRNLPPDQFLGLGNALGYAMGTPYLLRALGRGQNGYWILPLLVVLKVELFPPLYLEKI